MIDIEELKARAQRVLDRAPRPPHELPLDNPLRLLHEYVQGEVIDDLEGQVKEAREEASELEDSADAARREVDDLQDKVDDLQEKLDELRADIAAARRAALNELEAGRTGEALTRLVTRLGDFTGEEAKAA